MLCIDLHKYAPACATISGGISRVWIFDPFDYNFTSGAAGADGLPTGYSAVALRATSTGNMYRVGFLDESGEYTFDNPVSENGSITFSHNLTGPLINISQPLNNFLNSTAQAGVCCGLGVIMEFNSGVILVMGEKYVDAAEIRPFKVKMSSKGATGKKYNDSNLADVTFQGSYSRALYAYTGGAQSIIDLEPA